MRRMWISGVLGALLGWLVCAGLPRAACAQAAPPLVAAYVNFGQLFEGKTNLDERRKALVDCIAQARGCGFNVLIPYLTDTSGRALFPSTNLTDRVFGDWDPMKVLLGECLRYQMRVWPALCVLASGHEKPKGILRQHPEWALRGTNGAPLGHISPCRPEARQWVAGLCAEIVGRYQLPGLLLDYLRYPGHDIQLDEAAAREHPLPGAGASEAERRAFQKYKTDMLTEQMRLISEAARPLRPGLVLALYSWGPHVTTNHPVSQDWPAWGKLGYLNQVNISGYCFTNNYGDRYLVKLGERVRDAVALNRAVGSPLTVTFALGIETSHGRIEQPTEIPSYLNVAADHGAQGVAVFTWSYLTRYFRHTYRDQYFRKFSQRIESAAATPGK